MKECSEVHKLHVEGTKWGSKTTYEVATCFNSNTGNSFIVNEWNFEGMKWNEMRFKNHQQSYGKVMKILEGKKWGSKTSCCEINKSIL